MNKRVELMQRYERRLKLMVPAPMDRLKTLPIFAGIPEKAREKVIDKVRTYMHLVEFEPGEVILREGDYSDSAFYVVEGAVEVVLSRGGAAPAVRGGAHVPVGARAGARPGAEAMVGRAK